MKIDKITLHNFKCFEGTCAINGLTERLTSAKNIVLFGGLNGAGKTTIFEAILLGLYGNRNKTLWPSKGAKREDYQNYIISVVNANAKSRTLRTEMWIELTFKDIELGSIPRTLTVKRSWIIDSQTEKLLNDPLFVFNEKDEPFEFVPEDSWEDFIEELIPYEISQFFFFDGEKIQDFVKDEDKEFADSLEKVLGISLYEKLNNDLEKVRKRLLTDYNKDKETRVKINELNLEITQCETEISDLDEQVSDVGEEVRVINKKIEDIDAETRRITRVKAETLEEYETEKQRLHEQKGALEDKIFKAVDMLSFVITAPLCEELNQQLNNETELKEVLAAQRAIEPKIQTITEKLFEGEPSSPPILPEQQKFYSNKLGDILKEVLTEKPSHLKNVKVLHDLARDDVLKIQHRIQNSQEIVSGLKDDLNLFQETESKLKNISQTTMKTSDPEAAKLYDWRSELSAEIKFKERALEDYRVKIDKHQAEITSKKTQLKKLEDKSAAASKLKEQMGYCRKLRTVLDDFSHKLRAQKVDQLQRYTLSMWDRLARKEEQIHKIHINPDRHFSIDLYDSEGRLIDKTKLSAGEKELLAISLIWALAKLANRSLPVVIDTPLGRLDTIHRANIVKNYFSNASHQVLLLSTDTEIVGDEYDVVKPFVYQHYLIQKNEALETSKISEGYFSVNGQKA